LIRKARIDIINKTIIDFMASNTVNINSFGLFTETKSLNKNNYSLYCYEIKKESNIAHYSSNSFAFGFPSAMKKSCVFNC
jgi:hypothetical protein